MVDPRFTKLQTETQDPMRANDRMEILLPRCAKPQTEIAAPILLKLRTLMPRFHILNKPLDACIADFEPGHYSKANLSDLFEYLSEEQTEGFLKTLGEGMREGGRIAYWTLLVPRSRPESLANILNPLRDLAKSLWENDRAFFYGDFHIDEIIRG